ncbi:50S ribosomal protein L9 [Actinomarinicola tropica]|uniref:Large ribosomal subunit protein bL9 n=1 Tax=Actinomarinicola tropica TaxID=2789776 RepID=A0A5Q2RSI2_9ACTN|nr:50S ribosomal protein L9 [Actinomarinicola tropica]QGG96870.1 50S ribosomal protein L9 [Actinomarinicola tropica]
MKLVLRSDVDGVGKKGDVVDVADGYGRNFLVPKGLAFVATAGAAQQAASMRRSRDVKDAAARAAAQEIASTLVPTVITISAKAGGEGKLFGSVTTADVAEAVQSQTGIEIDRRQIHLDEPIKTTGTHTVPAKLHSEVEFPITVEVVAL